MSRILAPLAVVAGVLLLFGSAPFWWFGAGLVVAGIATSAVVFGPALQDLWADLRDERTVGPFTLRPQPLLKDLFAIAAIVVVGTALMWPSFLGDPPVSADHPVHMFRAWQLKEMIFEGRFYGWSHAWFGGYPAQYLYPIGGDLWVNAFYLGSFGMLSFYTAYALAIWAMFWLQGLAIYLFARRDIGRIAALVAALMVLGDDGAFRLGGWVFGLHWGVWPQNFCVVWAGLAVWQMRDVVLGKARRHLALFGFFMGMSILTHPLMIIFWAAAVPLAIFSLFASLEEIRRGVALLRLGVGTLIGGLFAAFWLLPFLSARDFAEGYGVAWQNSFALGEAVYQGNIFAGTWATAVILGGFVLVSWLGARRFMPTFFAAMGLALVIGGASDLVGVFHLLEVSDAFGFLQFTRFPILAKPFWFAAAAFGLVTLVRWTPEIADRARARIADEEGRTEPELESWSDGKAALFLRLAVLVTLLAPLGFSWLATLKVDQFTRGLQELSERPDNADRERLLAAVNKANEGVEGVARVGVDFGHDAHAMHDFQLGLDQPLYKVGYTPASSFQYKMERRNVGLLNQLNVRWMITPGRKLSARNWKKVDDFGRLSLHELKSWKPEPFTVRGEGHASLVLFDDEEIVIDAGPGASGELLVHVSDFNRWKAYRDGEPVDIRVVPHKAEPERTGFMAVDLAPGQYRFVFERHMPERLAWLALLLAMLLAAVMILSDFTRRPGPRLAALWERLVDRIDAVEERFAGRWVWVVGGAFALAAIGVLSLALWTPPLVHQFDPPAGDPVWDLGNDIADARVGLEANGSRAACPNVLGRHHCGDAVWEHVFTTYGGFGDDEWRRCVWAHPQKNRTLAIDIDDVPAGSRLVGYYGVSSSGASRSAPPVNLRVARDSTVIFEGTTKRDATLYDVDVPLDGSSFDLKVEVDAPNTGRRHFCFMLQVVE